jgi:nucleotide-binding universal stress UspA family protein
VSWKRILIAVDDSAATRRAIRYVIEMASPSKIDQIVLLHVLDPLPPALLEHSGGLDRDALDRLIQAREAFRHNREGAVRGAQGCSVWVVE